MYLNLYYLGVLMNRPGRHLDGYYLDRYFYDYLAMHEFEL